MENDSNSHTSKINIDYHSIPSIQISSPKDILRKETNNRISIFSNTRTISKSNSKLSKKSSNLNLINNNISQQLSRRKSRTILRYDTFNETIIKEIYKNENEDNYTPKLIQKFIQIPECSILKYGLRISNEDIDFSFCRTCDPNSINPICLPCIKICHLGHRIQKKYIKGQIKCICGERLHCISKKPDLTINNASCQLGEWFAVSKLKFYYNTKDNKCLCMLCYNFCNFDKSKESIKELKFENNNNGNNDNIGDNSNYKINNIPNCCCNNEDIHQERKIFFEKMETIAKKLDGYEYFNLLHPSQIINMIFLSKNQFNYNYADLNFFNEILLSDNSLDAEFIFFKKADFSSTNYYLIFKHLIELIKWNKHTDIAFYCKEAETYFSFKNTKLVLSLMNLMKYNEKSLWLLLSNFLTLFHKIYLGNLTQSFSKFKIDDLENFSCSQRILLRNLNKANFKESQNIINFFIDVLKNININGFTTIEALDTLNIIINIFKKLAIYDLFSNGDMIRVIHEIEKILFNIKLLRKLIFKSNQGGVNLQKKNTNMFEIMSILVQKNYEILFKKEIVLYYNIIKLISNFNLTFNDRLIYNALLNLSKYPTLDSINKDTVLFSFIKTDLGRAVIRLNIKIVYTLQNVYLKYLNEEKFKIIMNRGMKIFSWFLKNNDIYLLGILHNIKNVKFYKIGNEIEMSDSEYVKMIEEKNKLENCYKKFFIFENELEDVIKEVSRSIDVVLDKESNKDDKNFKLNEYKILCILKSNYFFVLSKFFQILDFFEIKKQNLPDYLKNYGIKKDNEEIIEDIYNKIYGFFKYFIFNSKDNSLILMSFYIFKNLCKAPIKYSIHNFELFLEATKNIVNNSIIITNIKDYLHNLYIYLEQLRNKSYSKINDCLLIYLNIIELFVLNIKSLNPDENIKVTKEIMRKINNKYKIIHNFFEHNSKFIDEKEEKYLKSFLSYMKIINNIFDFTNEDDKNKALKIIKPEKIMDYLKDFTINLNLRAELLKYIRKINIDLSYDENENSKELYANSIISTDDNLALLKLNPLISNFQYPTKLLSLYKDFLNLSVRYEMMVKSRQESLEINPTKNYTFKFNNTNKIDEESSHVQTFIKERNIEEECDDDKKSKKSKETKKSLTSKNPKSEIYDSDSDSASSSLKKIKLKLCFDDTIYELLMNELKNIKEITKDIDKDNGAQMENLRNYFENGLLIPLIYFLKKSFAFSHSFTGVEMIKLYHLIIESCKLRLYIADYKYDFWKENEEDESYDPVKEEEGNYCKLYNNKGNIIDGNFCVNIYSNTSTTNALNLLKSKKSMCFDFTFLYNIFNENIFSLLKDRKINSFKDFFLNEEKEISLKFITKEEISLFPDYENLNEINKRIIRLYILYKNGKKAISNENNSSLLSILPEICLEHETNYRNLLIPFLINNCDKPKIYEEENAIKSFCLLYKLLSLQTSETQNNLINIIGGNDLDISDLGFMEQLGGHLFKNIILLFIEQFNPPDHLLDINYVNSFLLIKIFKFLCEEHNNFFQCRLIKSLQYKYEQTIPIFYKETSRESESKNSNGENEKENTNNSLINENKNIKFFDFFLHVILKIILITEWDKLDYSNDNFHRQNNYLYDIFESILEMLNEIIQGNKPEYLNNLGNSIIDNKIEIENLVDGAEYYLNKSVGLIKITDYEKEKDEKNLEKVDNFRFFVKNVTDFLFSDKTSLELLYQIRNNLMEFFTTILEEKNCNEEVKKFIIKYLNINRVFNSISAILKSYYLRESSDTDIQYLLKSIKVDDHNLDKTLNYSSDAQLLLKNLTYSSHMEKNERKKVEFSTKIFPRIHKKFMRTIRQKGKKIIFNEKLLDYFRNLYFTIKEFNQTNEFKLSNAFYKYIKLIIVLNKSDEAKQLIEQAQSMSEETAKRKFLGEKKVEFVNVKKETKINNSKTLHLFNSLDNSELLDLNIKKNRTDKDIIRKLNSERNARIITKKTKPIINNNKNNNKNNDKKNEGKINLSLIKENKNEYDRDNIEHYYIIKFFESITTTVEVRTAGAINQTVIFTQPPEMIYLSNGTKSEFEREVNRDSETSKKNYLVRNVKYFQKEIKYYHRNQGNLSRLVSKVDFLYIQMASYIYALLFNLFILFSLKGDIRLSMNENGKGSIKSRRNKEGIQSLIDNSINKWANYYNIICYMYVIINGVFIFIWIYFRMPLYYKIDRLKYMEENNIQNKRHLKICQKAYIIIVMTIYDRDYILTLIYEFIFSLIGALMERGEIVYAFLLLPIIDLNNILKNIIVSVKLQYNEVCLTFFFAAIIMYAFSNIAYFFFKEDFAQEIEYQQDNVCDSLIFCFLNTIDSGLRARGGIGDSAVRLSYSRNKNRYISRLIVDDIFFILIVITAIDLVFGIILGAFSNLRNEEQKHSTDRKKHCFICHVNKNTLEKNRQNFNEHRTKVHNLWNYVDYMITLKFSDIHDLNAINSYASHKIANNDISWLPTYKDLTANQKKGNDIDEELKVEEENLNKYCVKTC